MRDGPTPPTEPGSPWRPWERMRAWGFTVALTAWVLWPAVRTPWTDSFPHSTYPMFTGGASRGEVTVDHALGVTTDRERIPLPPVVSAGTREVLQAAALLRAGVRRGAPTLERMCDGIAERVAARPELAGIEAVELATSRYDVLAYFEPGGGLLDRRLQYRCPVPR